MNAPEPRRAAVGLLLELRSVSLFRELGAEQLRPLAEVAQHVRHEAEDIIFEPSSPGDRLFVISEGKVEITRDDGAPELLQPGDTFGELSLLEAGPRRCRARAVEATTLLTVAREDFEALLQSYPDIARAIAAVLVEQLRLSLEPVAPVSRRLS